MNDKIYESDVQQLRIISQKIKCFVDELRNEAGRLGNDLDSLSVCWSSESGRKLISGFEQDKVQLEEAIKELEEFYDTMKKACETEEGTEETMKHLVAGIDL